MKTKIADTIIADAKEVAHQAIAAGVAAAGAFATGNAMQVADDVVNGDVAGLEHLGVGLSLAVAVAAWAAARKVLARVFGGQPPN